MKTFATTVILAALITLSATGCGGEPEGTATERTERTESSNNRPGLAATQQAPEPEPETLERKAAQTAESPAQTSNPNSPAGANPLEEHGALPTKTARPPTPAPVAQSAPGRTDDSSNQLREHSVLRTLPTKTPPPPTPTATPAPSPTETGQMSKAAYEEDLEICRFRMSAKLNSTQWVLSNQLDPKAMTDLQRYLWQPLAGEHDECWPYFAERLSEDNAHQRNWQHEKACMTRINNEKNKFYEMAGRRISREPERYHELTVNQYARIMNWLELSGEELLALQIKPHQLYQQLLTGTHNPAYIRMARLSGPTVAPTRLDLPWQEDEAYKRGETPIRERYLQSEQPAPLRSEAPTERGEVTEDTTLEQIEWHGFGRAFTHSGECILFFPQLFTGFWIPGYNPGGYAEPVPELEGERSLLTPEKYLRTP